MTTTESFAVQVQDGQPQLAPYEAVIATEVPMARSKGRGHPSFVEPAMNENDGGDDDESSYSML